MPRNKTRPPFIRITRAIVGESSKLYRCSVLPGARKNGISRFRHRDSFRRAVPLVCVCVCVYRPCILRSRLPMLSASIFPRRKSIIEV